MCYVYSLKKKVLKEELKIRKEAVSVRKQVNAWIMEAKKALITNKPKHPDSSQEASSNVRERLAG